jgi:hypothetical protein
MFRTLLFSLAGSALLLATGAACADVPGGDADAAFMRLADEFFDHYYFPTNPTTATLSGIHDYDTRLEDFSRAAIDRQIATLKDYQRRV